MAASLRVDATIAQIDNETSRANQVRGYLWGRRNRSVDRYNLLSVIVAGGWRPGSSMQFVSNLEKAGNTVDIVTGTVSAGLAVAGIMPGGRPTDSTANRRSRPNSSIGRHCLTAAIPELSDHSHRAH